MDKFKVCYIVKNVLESFDANNIKYCHWKSNEHIGAAVSGRTDLDVLFEESDAETVREIFQQNGFKNYNSPKYRSYPYIFDYIKVNPENNSVIHFHTHFRLIIGETNVKSYRLPWEKDILDSRIFNEKHGIYTSAVEYELLLLITRVCLKNDFSRRFGIRSILYSSKVESENSVKEFQWLIKRIDKDKLEQIANMYFGATLSKRIVQICADVDSYSYIKQLRTEIQNAIKSNRRYNAFQVFLISNKRDIQYFTYKILNKFKITNIPIKRVLSDGGVICTFIGVDGAGKTTTTKNVYNVLAKKFDVKMIYMGSGKGQSSFLRAPLNYIKLKFHSVHATGKNRRRESKKIIKSFLKEMFNIVWAIVLYRERSIKLKKIKLLKRKGYLIITDRFPQNRTTGFNDGPLLTAYKDHPFFLLRYFYKKEQLVFNQISEIYPDLVFKLYANVDILERRRPEMSLSTILRKSADIEQQFFDDRTVHVLIDTGSTEETVCSNVLMEIDRFITNRQHDY